MEMQLTQLPEGAIQFISRILREEWYLTRGPFGRLSG